MHKKCDYKQKANKCIYSNTKVIKHFNGISWGGFLKAKHIKIRQERNPLPNLVSYLLNILYSF